MNPLVALFFSVEKDKEFDSNIWCMGFPSTNNCLEYGSIYSQRKTLRQVDFVRFPGHINDRIINQDGCFTLHDSETPLNQDPNNTQLITFNKIVVNKINKDKIQSELYDIGIHKSFIYPGLDSLAERIKYEINANNYRKTCL